MANVEKSGKRELMTTMVVVLLLTLVGAGAGFAVGSLLGESTMASAEAVAPPGPASQDTALADDPAGKAKEEPAVQEHEDPEETHSDDITLAPFPPVLTTLADPKGKWIRLEGSVMIATGGEKQPELLAEEAGEQILTYLRSVRLSQLQSASGILALRDDIDETVQVLSGGEIRGVLIHGLVVE